MLVEGLLLEDDAFRIKRDQDDFIVLTDDDQISVVSRNGSLASWEDVRRLSHTSLVVAKPIPTEALTLSNSSQVDFGNGSVCSWEEYGLFEGRCTGLPGNNKFVLTSWSIQVPWSLEGVIRPESPRSVYHSVVEADDVGEEEYQESICEKKAMPQKGSVVARTARLPLALASDVVVLVLRLLWAPPIRPSDPSSHVLSPYLFMAI